LLAKDALSYSQDGTKVDKMAEQVDDIVLGRRQLLNFLAKEGIRAKSINDRQRSN